MKHTPKTAAMKHNNLDDCLLEFAADSHVVCLLIFGSYLVALIDFISKHRLSCPPTIPLIVAEGGYFLFVVFACFAGTVLTRDLNAKGNKFFVI